MIVLTGLGPECSAIHLRQVFRGDAVLPRFRGGGEQRFHGLAGSLVVGIQLFLPAFAFLRPEMGIGGTNRKPEDTKSDQQEQDVGCSLVGHGYRNKHHGYLPFLEKGDSSRLQTIVALQKGPIPFVLSPSRGLCAPPKWS